MNHFRELELDRGYDSSGIDGGLVYYSAEYGRFLKSVLRAESKYLSSGPDREIAALLPMMITEGPSGRVMNALPFFGSHGAPIVKSGSETSVTDLLGYVENGIRSGLWNSVTVVENPLSPMSYEEVQCLQFLTPVDDRISQITHRNSMSTDSLESLMSHFHSKMRNAIRKGAMSKQEVRLGGSDSEWEFLIRGHQRSIIELDGVPKSDEVFRCLRQILGETIRLHCGYVGGKIVTALLTIRHGKTTEYFVPVVESSRRHQQVLPHLIATVMLQDFRDGVDYWNWGGTWRNQPGVMQFKSRFSATNRPYRYFNWCDAKMQRLTIDEIRSNYRYWYVRKV